MIIDGTPPTRFDRECEVLARGDVFYPEPGPESQAMPPYICTGHDRGFCFATSLRDGSQMAFRSRMVAVVAAALIVAGSMGGGR